MSRLRRWAYCVPVAMGPGLAVQMAAAAGHVQHPGGEAPGAEQRDRAEANRHSEFIQGVPRCPSGVSYCFPLVVHIVTVNGHPRCEPTWWAGQVAGANELFAPISTGFQVLEVRSEPREGGDIVTREDRDALGRGQHDGGVIHVWLVGRLADVDAPGEVIRGVHWRDRANRARRYVILSNIAGPKTLAHELGHFFGLPHGTDRASIMNKRLRLWPPPSQWGFVASEQARMKRRRAAMIEDGTLRTVKHKRRPTFDDGRPRGGV